MDTKDLNDDEKCAFLIMQGFAVGAAYRAGDKILAHALLALSNKLNADNPNFRPYEIPEDEKKPAPRE